MKKYFIFIIVILQVIISGIFVTEINSAKGHGTKPPDGYVTSYYGTPGCQRKGSQCWTSNRDASTTVVKGEKKSEKKEV